MDELRNITTPLSMPSPGFLISKSFPNDRSNDSRGMKFSRDETYDYSDVIGGPVPVRGTIYLEAPRF